MAAPSDTKCNTVAHDRFEHRMIEAATATNEADRLAALRKLAILDTPAEERFDRITRLAARLFEAPIALVSLVDEHRQWFKSRVGLDLPQTDRTISFCDHAVAADALLAIEDTHSDVRFADNPLVTGDLGVRFYAGQPVHAPTGEAIGTICILDRVPRTFSAADADTLADLAALVEEELSDRRRLDELEQRVRRDDMVTAVLTAMHESVIVLDARGQVEFYSARSQSASPPVDLTRAHLEAIHGRTIDVDGHPDSMMTRIDELVHHGAEFSNVVLGLTTGHATTDSGQHNVEDPSIQWFLSSGIRFGDRSMITSRDITELQVLRRDLALSESARLASDQRFELIVRYSSDIVSVVDTAGRVSFVSPAAFRLLGHSLGEGQDDGMLTYVFEIDRPTMLEAIQAVGRGELGSERPFVVRVETASGDVVHLECRRVDAPARPGRFQINAFRRRESDSADMPRCQRTSTAHDTAGTTGHA
jgi:PAS domain S-box-containing protein